MYLCEPSSAQVQDFILDQFVTLWDEYAADRPLIPEGNLVEVGYEQLAADPIGTLGAIYERLGWDAFEQLRPRLEKQLAGHRAYVPNAHSQLPADLEALVDERWRDYATAWGYR